MSAEQKVERIYLVEQDGAPRFAIKDKERIKDALTNYVHCIFGNSVKIEFREDKEALGFLMVCNVDNEKDIPLAEFYISDYQFLRARERASSKRPVRETNVVHLVRDMDGSARFLFEDHYDFEAIMSEYASKLHGEGKFGYFHGYTYSRWNIEGRPAYFVEAINIAQ